MSGEELENLKKETDELEYDLVLKQNIYIEQLQNKIKELEDRLNVQTICGYPIKEAIRILNAITLERAYDIKVTMDNLQEFMKIYQKEQTEMLRETLSKTDYEWPPDGKEIKIPKIDLPKDECIKKVGSEVMR